MADRLGHQFYSRCPEHVKSAFLKKSLETSNRNADDDSEKHEPKDPIDIENSAGTGRGQDTSLKTSPPIAPINSPSSVQTPSTKYSQTKSRYLRNPFKKVPKHATKNVDNNPPPLNYGRIFFGALHATLVWRWWIAGMFKLIGGKSAFFASLTLPLHNS